VTLAELTRMGRLEEIDAARVQALRSMADVVDRSPSSPQMWREYRNALEELIASDDQGDLSALIAELQSDPGDAEEG
jgi:hypothetical protein